MAPPGFAELSVKALHPFDIGGIAEKLGLQSKGNKKWYNVTFEIVTATVGVGAFALPETVGVDGIVVYTCIFLVLTLINFISCSYWNEHKVLWNAQADKDPSLDRMVTYEDWGKVAFGNMGLMMQTAIQLGYYVLLCVVFVKLLDENISAVLLRNVGGEKTPFTVMTNGTFDPKLLAKEMNEKGTLQIRLNTAGCLGSRVNETTPVAEEDLVYYVKPKVVTKFAKSYQLKCTFDVKPKDLGEFTMSGKDKKEATWKRTPGLFGNVEDTFTAELTNSFKVMQGLDEVIIPIDQRYISFESGESTNSMELFSKVLTVALQVGFTIMYERADKFVFGNGFFGICGVIGVFVSWAMIIIHIAIQFAAVVSHEEVNFAEHDFWMPKQDTPRSAFAVLDGWSFISATAFGAWAMIGLVPSMSAQMENPRDFGKTMISSYLICGIIYYLPVFIYVLNGKEKKVLDMMSFQSENKMTVGMTWMLRLGVIMNMIASYAVTLYPPATTSETLVAKKFGVDQGNFMVKVAVRGAFSLLVVSLAFGMGGTFGKVFTIISATFVPISTGMAPFLYDLKLKWEVAKLEGDKSTLPTYLTKRFLGEGPKATAKMMFMSVGFVVAAITIPFGINYGVQGVAESWKLSGLQRVVEALVVLPAVNSTAI